MKNKRLFPHSLRPFALMAAAVCLPLLASGQTTFTWTGNSGNSWGTAANWNPSAGSPPGTAATDIASFSGTSVNVSIDLASAVTLGQLEFLSGASAYTLGGSAITIERTGGTFITQSAGNTQTVNSQVTLTGTTTTGNIRYIDVSSGSALRLLGGLTAVKSGTATDTNVTLRNGGTLELGGALSGVNNFTVTGTGSVFNYNPSNGGSINTITAIAGGTANLLRQTSATLVVSGDGSAIYGKFSGSLGSGTNTQRFSPTANGTVTLGADIQGGGTVTVSRATSLNYAGTVTGATMRFEAKASNILDFTGVISDTNAAGTGTKVEITGAGFVRFSGTSANTSVTPIEIVSGTLELAKTAGVNAIAGGSVTLGSGGTLRLAASNQIADTTSVSLSGGTFNAASYSETVGSLTVSSAGGTIDFGGAAGSLTFSGLSSIAGTLTINGWTDNASIVFSSGAGWDSTALSKVVFTGYGAALFDSATGELYASAIPEPASAAGVIAAVSLVLGTCIRRRVRI